MKKIKKYYRIEFQLTSPLSVGSGENYITDKDIIKDSRGIPYIPGTSLAGIYRSLFSKKTAETYFGPELTQERIQESAEQGKNVLENSAVVTYDASLLDTKEALITKRDMAALDEYKTAVPGAKFDFQILEPGAVFVTYIEQNMEREEESWVIDEIADAWMQGMIRTGAKTGRGYGRTQGKKAVSAQFNLEDSEELKRWLDFDMYNPEDKNWKQEKKDESAAPVMQSENIRKMAEKEICAIHLELHQKGGISIRQYSTEVGEADYRQLTARNLSDEKIENSAEGTPVIPGTSWAGAFRAQMGKLSADFGKYQPLAEKFFGKAKNKEADSRKSRISFSESRIKRGKWVVYTRNAIDRFTGGTVDGALYTEKTYYNGSTDLEILCDFSSGDISDKDRKKFAQVMAAAILDLNSGYMSVGGLTAVGRGIFEVKKIAVDGNVYVPDREKPEGIYSELAGAIAGKEKK